MNTWMSQEKKKKTKQNKTKTHTKIHEILQFFVLTKRIRKKKKLIKAKLQIANTDMRIIKWPQQVHNKFYATSY